MRLAWEWAKEYQTNHWSPKPETLTRFFQEAQIEAFQHAANVARIGKVRDAQNELERGNNLARDCVVENLEHRIKEIKEGK